MSKAPMTKAGAKALRSELEKLKNEDRPRVIQAISTAREHGDLRENAEYHAAREQQGFIEGRIKDIEAKLSIAEVIDTSQLGISDKIVFGATVTIVYNDTGEEITYRIVGEDEADIERSLLSYASPLARALIGKHVGDDSTIQAPRGERTCKIISVGYIS